MVRCKGPSRIFEAVGTKRSIVGSKCFRSHIIIFLYEVYISRNISIWTFQSGIKYIHTLNCFHETLEIIFEIEWPPLYIGYLKENSIKEKARCPGTFAHCDFNHYSLIFLFIYRTRAIITPICILFTHFLKSKNVFSRSFFFLKFWPYVWLVFKSGHYVKF